MTGAYDAWLGRVEMAEDSVTARDTQRMAATLAPDHGPVDPTAGAPLPPLWHWMAFAPALPAAELGRDGHPALGGFLPPVEGRRRMWAGGRLRLGPPLRVEEALRRRSEITRIAEKSGGAGPMLLVTVAHRIEGASGGWVEEEQDLVYVALPERFSPPPGVAPAADPVLAHPFRADSTQLFRFSALTFNGHRIHYDLPYAQTVEKYPGLVVHGPLQAVLMMEAARRHAGRVPDAFRYRGLRPLFPEDAPQVMGWRAVDGRQALAVVAQGGWITMQAEADFA
ncbi:MAG TPA: MaoC family dehydratase N-terminal domain-containing protein [Paracoccaceae bacterium]|nr:MaoC family dehydratase N-terminal domain-containing protein [Paracoccaceae bacterium]